MRAPPVPPPPSTPASSALPPATRTDVWVAGTLRYTKPGLFVLFFWLLWNDLCLMLMEKVAPLTPLLLKDHGASNAQIAFFTSTLGLAINIWFNPLISTCSDRYRSPYGRRRPFLFFAAPGSALMLCLIPFGPDIAKFLGLSSVTGIVITIGICYLFYSVFNDVILALFTYYFWDVVPEEMLGRFTALMKVISTIAGFVWNYFFFGLAEHHMKGIFIGFAAFFLTVYLFTLWRVKEGEYPPPDEQMRGKGFLWSIRTYFVECYSEPYYLWFYGANIFFQMQNLSGIYKFFYVKDTLALSLDTIGKMSAFPSLIIVVFAYPLGVLVDRMKPARLAAPSLVIWSLLNVTAFFFLRGKWSMLFCDGAIAITTFFFGISYSVLNVEIFPKEKRGQLCSANSATYQIVMMLLAVPMGMLFDHLHNYSYGYLWSAGCNIIAALMFLKVYFNWKRVSGHSPI